MGLERSKFKNFVFECVQQFIAKPVTYREERSKIIYAGSYLEGPAHSHYATLVQDDPNQPILQTWDLFVDEFQKMFGIPFPESEAQDCLANLRMRDSEQFSTFLTKFVELVTQAHYDDSAKRRILRNIICKRLSKELRKLPPPTTFATLTSLLQRFDQAYWSGEYRRRRENKDWGRKEGKESLTTRRNPGYTRNQMQKNYEQPSPNNFEKTANPSQKKKEIADLETGNAYTAERRIIRSRTALPDQRRLWDEQHTSSTPTLTKW